MTTWHDNVNHNVKDQISLAVKLGLHIPDFIPIANEKEMTLALLNPDTFIREDYAFQKTLGTQVGFAAYYNGDRFVNYIGIIRDSFMFSGSQGVELDDNIIMIYGIDYRIVSLYFKRMDKFLKEIKSSFIGFVQLNVFVDHNKKFWYDSITIGAQPELVEAFKLLVGHGDYTSFDEPLFFNNRYACSAKVVPFGWPYSPIKHISEDAEIILDTWGLIPDDDVNCFFCLGKGERIKDAWKELYHNCAGVERFNYIYRIDGYDICKQRFHEVKQNELV